MNLRLKLGNYEIFFSTPRLKEMVFNLFCRRTDDFSVDNDNRISALKRQGETSIAEIPMFDQHVSYLASLPTSIWVFPLGIFAVGMRYKDAITEFTDLVWGLVSNILQSIAGIHCYSNYSIYLFPT